MDRRALTAQGGQASVPGHCHQHLHSIPQNRFARETHSWCAAACRKLHTLRSEHQAVPPEEAGQPESPAGSELCAAPVMHALTPPDSPHSVAASVDSTAAHELYSLSQVSLQDCAPTLGAGRQDPVRLTRHSPLPPLTHTHQQPCSSCTPVASCSLAMPVGVTRQSAGLWR